MHFSRGVNVIVGRNGQGKTNLVEAIHLLSLSKSFRTAESRELVRWGEKAGSVFGVITETAGETELGVAFEEKGRGYYLNGQRLKTVTDFVGRFLCVCFSPSDLLLVQGAPAERRRFIDKHLADLMPAHMGSLLAYNRAIHNKNRMLKEGVADLSLLDPWNQILAEEALRIVRAREEFILMLRKKAAEMHTGFCEDDAPLALALSSNVTPALRTREALLEEYGRYRSREAACGRALLGPHRDDMLISLGGNDARAFASQGQGRSIVLSLTLGVIVLLEEQRKESPVVLLDDVNSELDSRRSDAFFSLVLRQGRQIFVTGTDTSVGHLDTTQGYEVFEMSAGRLSRREAKPLPSRGRSSPHL